MGDLVSSGKKTATQTDIASPAAKMLKMCVYLPVMVTTTFRAISLSNIER